MGEIKRHRKPEGVGEVKEEIWLETEESPRARWREGFVSSLLVNMEEV